MDRLEELLILKKELSEKISATRSFEQHKTIDTIPSCILNDEEIEQFKQVVTNYNAINDEYVQHNGYLQRKINIVAKKRIEYLDLLKKVNKEIEVTSEYNTKKEELDAEYERKKRQLDENINNQLKARPINMKFNGL
jgi:hypothetical protein